MTKMSDNASPSLLFTEQGSAPTTPASGKWRLFTKADGLYIVDDTGAVTGPFGSSSGTFNQDTMLPWHVSIIPMVVTPDATTGTWATSGNSETSLVHAFYQPGSTANSGGALNFNNATGVAVNDAVTWDVILAAGTWDFHAWVRKSTNTAIITLNQDGSSQGTVDTYAASPASAKVSITGWTVATTGKHSMQLKAATKNASSSNYVLQLMALEFRRTA